MKRILGIWLPNWPIQRVVVARPELKHQPVILFRRDARRGQVVAACSPTARKQGARVDMSLSEASSLTHSELQKLPVSGLRSPASPTIEPHDHAADLTTLKSLAESCDQFSPVVGIEQTERNGQTEQPSTIYLDVTRLDHLFGGYENLALLVARHFQSLGYYVHVCIAETIGAAWGLTHFAPYELQTLNHPDHSSSTPSISPSSPSGLRSPASDLLPIPFVTDTQHNFPWQHLPVAALRIEPGTLETLHQLGITRIAQLLELPRTSLSSRLGAALLKRLDQISGELDEPIVAHHLQPEFEAFQFIEHPTRRRDTIDFIVWEKTQEICRQLADRQRGALKIICKFRCEQNQNKESEKRQELIRIGLFQPSAIASHLIELIRMQLEQTTMPAAVEYISLQVTLSAPLVQQQRQLFGQSVQQDWQQLAQLVNRLSSRLGPESVLRPVLQSSAQPEHAVRYQKMTGQLTTATLKRSATQRKRNQRNAKSKRSSASTISGLRPPASDFSSTPLPCPFQRPLLLHKNPIRLETIAIVNDDNGTEVLSPVSKETATAALPPAAFTYLDRQHRIASHFGPERIETGWWRAPIAMRDYYRIETDAGHRFWIYKNLRDHQWYLHGEF